MPSSEAISNDRSKYFVKNGGMVKIFKCAKACDYLHKQPLIEGPGSSAPAM